MDWQGLLTTAESVAREAGAVLKAGAPHLRTVNLQTRDDVKLQADVESEQLIRRRLAAASPFPVYGEELGGDEGLLRRYEPYWVVDPLDGTYNYLRGSALCAVSIGLLRGLTPLLGVIYEFASDTCFSGVVAQGLHVNGQPVQPAWAATPDQAVLATGFPAGMDRSPERMQAFLGLLAPFKKVRMVGSAALALAYVAAGLFDVYHEESIRLWDVAAGLALIQAGGGTVRMRPSRCGTPLTYDVWAGKEAFFPN